MGPISLGRFALAMTGDSRTCTMPNLPAPSDPNRLIADPDRSPAVFKAIIEDDVVPKNLCTPTGRARVTYETLTVETDDDGVTLLTLSRPEAMNSFTVTMARELEAFFLAAADDDAIRAIVVTGAGKAFCAGMDLSAEGNVFGLDESASTRRPRRCGSTSPRSRSTPASATPAAR